MKSVLVAIKLTDLFYCSSNLLTVLLPAKFYCSPNFIAPQIFKIFSMSMFIMDPINPFQTLSICKTH